MIDPVFKESILHLWNLDPQMVPRIIYDEHPKRSVRVVFRRPDNRLEVGAYGFAKWQEASDMLHVCAAQFLAEGQMGDQQYKAVLLQIQDNRATSHPIYVLERRERIYGIKEGGEWAWVKKDTYDEVTDEATIAKLNATASSVDEPTLPPEEEGDEPQCYERSNFVDTWRFEQVFITQEAMDDHIKSQKHNLGVFRTFVYSGWRNQEWQFLRQLVAGERLKD